MTNSILTSGQLELDILNKHQARVEWHDRLISCDTKLEYNVD